MDVERAVESLVLGLNRESLTLEEVHDALRQVAELVGRRPQTVTGPRSAFTWRLGDRGITVEVDRLTNRRLLALTTFDWTPRDDEFYRCFKWAEGADVPYLWSLPIAGGHEWGPGGVIATNWRTFVDCFGPCLDDLPTDLQAIPPDWRPKDLGVVSMWNVDGPTVGGVSVTVSPAGVVIDGQGPASSGFELTIPADRLGAKKVSVPAILAGLTTTGSYAELQFWENDTGAIDVFPVGVKAEQWGTDELGEAPVDSPRATMSLAEARAILDAPVEPAAQHRRQDGGPFNPTMPVGHAIELAAQLAQYNGDAPAVLKAWGVELDDRNSGALHQGRVRCRPNREGPEHSVKVELVSSTPRADDLSGSWAYGNELSNALMERFGPPKATTARSTSSGGRLWQVDELGVWVRVDRSGVELAVAPWEFEFLGLIGVL